MSTAIDNRSFKPSDIQLLPIFEMRSESRRTDTDTFKALVAQVAEAGRPDALPLVAFTDEDGNPLPEAKGGKPSVVAGRTRHLACLKAGLSNAPYEVVSADHVSELVDLAARENFVRSELTPFEKGEIINRFKDAGANGDDIAAKLGISTGLVSIYSKRAKLAPHVAREAVVLGKLTNDDVDKILSTTEKQVSARKTQKGEDALKGDALAAAIMEAAEKKVASRIADREKNPPRRGGDRKSVLARPFGTWIGVDKAREMLIGTLEGEADHAKSEWANKLSTMFGFSSWTDAKSKWDERQKALETAKAKAKAERDAKKAERDAKRQKKAPKKDAAPAKNGGKKKKAASK